MLKNLRRASELDALQWRLLLRAVLEIIRARLQFGILPLPRILAKFEMEEVAAERSIADERTILIAWAIGVAARYIPLRSDCLIQAMAANRWLRTMGKRPVLNVGVSTNESNFRAHAWLVCHGISVTGGTGQGFTSVTSGSSHHSG